MGIEIHIVICYNVYKYTEGLYVRLKKSKAFW